MLIAYVIPGYVAVLGIAYHAVWFQHLLGQDESEAASLAGVVLLTVLSVLAGLIASTIRWLVLDAIHHRLGVTHGEWNFQSIENRVDGFQLILESHYRYYQFYGNSLISIPFYFVLRWNKAGFHLGELLGMILIAFLFALASRDSLQKYYRRTESLLQPRVRR